MPLRIHPVSRARWARLADSRFQSANDRRVIDLVAMEESEQGRRMRTEYAQIQAHVDGLAPKVAR
jgi:hypothetical protein